LCLRAEDGNQDESAVPKGGGGFADYALVSFHSLRISLNTSYRIAIDLLKEMSQITGEIGRIKAGLPAPSTLCRAFDSERFNSDVRSLENQEKKL